VGWRVTPKTSDPGRTREPNPGVGRLENATAFTGTDPSLLRLVRVRGLPDARLEHPYHTHIIGRTHFHDAQTRRQSQNPPLQKSCAAPTFPWPSDTTFEKSTRVGPDNSLERLTERSVGLVTDRPSDVYELFVMLFE
jgi:hypothetical protein